MQILLKKAKDSGLVAGTKKMMNYLQEQGLAWVTTIKPELIGCHPLNRSGAGIDLGHLQELIESISEVRFVDMGAEARICIQLDGAPDSTATRCIVLNNLMMIFKILYILCDILWFCLRRLVLISTKLCAHTVRQFNEKIAAESQGRLPEANNIRYATISGSHANMASRALSAGTIEYMERIPNAWRTAITNGQECLGLMFT